MSLDSPIEEQKHFSLGYPIKKQEHLSLDSPIQKDSPLGLAEQEDTLIDQRPPPPPPPHITDRIAPHITDRIEKNKFQNLHQKDQLVVDHLQEDHPLNVQLVVDHL